MPFAKVFDAILIVSLLSHRDDTFDDLATLEPLEFPLLLDVEGL